MENRTCWGIIKLGLVVNMMIDNLMAVLKAMRANVSYPVLTVCCTQSPLCQAWARTPPNFGSTRLQLCQIPVKHIQHGVLHLTYLYTEQSIWISTNWEVKILIAVAHTCSSSSSLFFLPSDWFLWGNRKSSAAVGTPGNTATKSCSSGKSDTCDKAEIWSISYDTLWQLTASFVSLKHVILFFVQEIIQIISFTSQLV